MPTRPLVWHLNHRLKNLIECKIKWLRTHFTSKQYFLKYNILNFPTCQAYTDMCYKKGSFISYKYRLVISLSNMCLSWFWFNKSNLGYILLQIYPCDLYIYRPINTLQKRNSLGGISMTKPAFCNWIRLQYIDVYRRL